MNESERVITLDDGQRVTDPVALLENWLEKEGYIDLPFDEFIDALNEWHENMEAEALTGDLFAEAGT